MEVRVTDTVYYEVTGDEPLAFCRDWRDRAKAVEAIYSDYAEARGGIGFVRQMRDRFGGIIFKDKPPVGWREHKTPCRDGTYFAKPVKRGEGAVEGKAIQAEIDALPTLPADEEFCRRFGFPMSVTYQDGDRTGTAAITNLLTPAQIAWIDDNNSFWIVLPDFAERVAELEGKGWTVTPREWSLPDGLKPSSRARYELARAAAKVAAEEASPAHINRGAN